MKDNLQRGKIAVILLWVILFLDVLTALSSYLQLNLLTLISEGIDIPEAEANANDLRESVIGIIYTIARITCAVDYIRWFRRAYYNLHQKEKNLLYTEGWAAGSWFIPFINLIRPYQIMKELYEKTHKILSKNLEEYQRQVSFTFIGIWWALWVITNILANVEMRILFGAESVDELILSTNISIASALLGVPLALLAIKVVKDYIEMETSLFSLRAHDGEFNHLDFSKGEDILDAFE